MNIRTLIQYISVALSGLFDYDYYYAENADVKSAGMDPLLHYLIHGWKENRNPSREFDALYYFSTYPEVKKANINPLLDFIQRGKKAGRKPSESTAIGELHKNKPNPLNEIRKYLKFQRARKFTNRWNENSMQAESDDSDIYFQAYQDILSTANNQPPVTYNPYQEHEPSIENEHARVIAMYLPQYHPIPENDEWWGKGFTEWTNASKASPQFLGHYQPHLPGELGFYDLRIFENFEKQVKLALNYGIYGFCFHYYWFNGKKMLEKPIEAFLRSDLDFPFCICWANENWTRGWEGRDNITLIGQEHTLQVDMNFIRDIEPILKDPRYIRVNDRPFIVVYRTSVFDDPVAVAKGWREYCQQAGIGNPFLVAAQTYGFSDPRPIDFDAALQFPPLNHRHKNIRDQFTILNKNFSGEIYSYYAMSKKYIEVPDKDYTIIRAVCPGWDNEPRKPGRGSVYHPYDPAAYQNWLEQVLIRTEQHQPAGQRFVFVNAWNEWAEGAHLEPDRKFGYSYLSATKKALVNVWNFEFQTLRGMVRAGDLTRNHDTAVVLHVYYPELFTQIAENLKNINGFDLYLSLPDSLHMQKEQVWKTFPEAKVLIHPNRGRDILPFIQIYKAIYPLGYRYLLKLHTKKTPHRKDGAEWFNDILSKLVGSPILISRLIDAFESNKEIGLIGASSHVLSSRYHLGINEELIKEFVNKYHIEQPEEYHFPAGTMFWVRPASLSKLCTLPIILESFPEEPIPNDGTIVHALERLIGLIIASEGYKVYEVNTEGRVGESANTSDNYSFA